MKDKEFHVLWTLTPAFSRLLIDASNDNRLLITGKLDDKSAYAVPALAWEPR